MESDAENLTNLSKEERWQHKKARKESMKKVREEAELELQRRDALLAGTSGSAIPTPSATSQLDPVQDSKSATIDNGVDTAPTNGI